MPRLTSRNLEPIRRRLVIAARVGAVLSSVDFGREVDDGDPIAILEDRASPAKPFEYLTPEQRVELRTRIRDVARGHTLEEFVEREFAESPAGGIYVALACLARIDADLAP